MSQQISKSQFDLMHSGDLLEVTEGFFAQRYAYEVLLLATKADEGVFMTLRDFGSSLDSGIMNASDYWDYHDGKYAFDVVPHTITYWRFDTIESALEHVHQLQRETLRGYKLA